MFSYNVIAVDFLLAIKKMHMLAEICPIDIS
jgi:hypothetical protein